MVDLVAVLAQIAKTQKQLVEAQRMPLQFHSTGDISKSIPIFSGDVLDPVNLGPKK